MPRRGDNKISEFVLLSEMMLRVSVDTGNCVGLKEFYCESFKKKATIFSFFLHKQ